MAMKGPDLPSKGPLRSQFTAWMCDRERAQVRGGPQLTGEAVRDQREQESCKCKASFPGACIPGPEKDVPSSVLPAPSTCAAGRDRALPTCHSHSDHSPSPRPPGFPGLQSHRQPFVSVRPSRWVRVVLQNEEELPAS